MPLACALYGKTWILRYPKKILLALFKSDMKAGPLSVTTAAALPNTQNTRPTKVRRVSSAVVEETGMNKLNRVRAHTTTKMFVYGPERDSGPLWSTWMTEKGREGVGMG
jgi:hypothetical protein